MKHFETDEEAQEYFKTYAYCPNCTRPNCPHRNSYRRMPEEVGGLGLCPVLPDTLRSPFA